MTMHNLIERTTSDNNAVADCSKQFHIGIRTAVPLIMDRRCIGEVIPKDDII